MSSKKLTQNEIITEVVYALFDETISLNDPQTTISEIKAFIRNLKKRGKK